MPRENFANEINKLILRAAKSYSAKFYRGIGMPRYIVATSIARNLNFRSIMANNHSSSSSLSSFDQARSRYIIGIDLGTTNSAVAYVDTDRKKNPTLATQLFWIPQQTLAGIEESKTTLPSFCYLEPGKNPIVGTVAKELGAKTPGRMVSSAKSWLCHSGSARNDPILPFPGIPTEKKLSPVEVTSRYLAHIRSMWDREIAQGNLELEFDQQEIILTIPASFDEVARALTIESAKRAGYRSMTLLEEPSAAFYSWIQEHQKDWQELVSPGDQILVCDVGGGTTDFSLIEVVVDSKGEKGFQRMRVGPHLLLGGDNLDFALARLLEEKIEADFSGSSGSIELDAEQKLRLRHLARDVKERIFSVGCEDLVRVTLQGKGRSVVKGSISVDINRNEAMNLILKGFFGQVPFDQALTFLRTTSLKSMGLPYEEEPNVLKHVANFLFGHTGAQASERKMPDYILYNGGTMKPALFQQAIIDGINSWFSTESCSNGIQSLASISLDTAVSRGAAYYGKVRRGLESVRIGGGSSQGFYLGVQADAGAQGGGEEKLLTLLAKGSVEGAEFSSEQIFHLIPNQPVAMKIYTSQVRLNDQPGQIIPLNQEEFRSLPPIHTLLRYGSRERDEIPVRLGAQLTELGTLDLWLQSIQSQHRWQLEFQLRTASGEENAIESIGTAREDETFDSELFERVKGVLNDLFIDRSQMERVIPVLERVIGAEKELWAPSLLRAIADWLLDHPKVGLSPALSERWWNLLGYSLRPGFGYPLDDHRVKKIWKIFLGVPASLSLDEQLQRYICLRRIAGGLSKGQQIQLANPVIAELLDRKRHVLRVKGKRERMLYPEQIRMLGSFEFLPLPIKIDLGEALVHKIEKEELHRADLWSLARLGGRQLVYGGISDMVPTEKCAVWATKALSFKQDEELSFLLNQLTRKSGLAEMDVDEKLRAKARIVCGDEWDDNSEELMRQGSASPLNQLLGDSLPLGLKI